MYSVIFEADNGKKYTFGRDGNTMFDMDLGSGVSVDLGTSQGFAQVGESVETQSVKGRTITVTGAVYGNKHERKALMRNVFAPFVAGKLIFQNKYYIRVYVKDTPSFSTVKNNGNFSMRFFAPFPFFLSSAETSELIGGITPQFRFPVNYSTPHRFGSKSQRKYTNIINNGDVAVPFSLRLSSDGRCTNITVTNLETLEFLKLNGTLDAGQTIDVFRDDNGVLRVIKTAKGIESDALFMVDDASTLFSLNVGDNLIQANDQEGGASLTARFSFSPAVVAVYES